MARRCRATLTIEWTPSDAYPTAEYVLWGTIFPALPVQVKIEEEGDVGAENDPRLGRTVMDSVGVAHPFDPSFCGPECKVAP